MAVPSVNPIEIRIRDGIAETMPTVMTIANGYYYNIGDINVYERSNVEKWPLMLIKIIGEENTDETGAKPSNTHYTNKLSIECKYIFKNDDAELDRDLICARLLHDLKLYLGDYYRLSSYGCYQVRPVKMTYLKSSNDALPSGVSAEIECDYSQLRTQPTSV